MENLVYLIAIVIQFVLVFGSIVLHEIAHGYVAWQLGDPTARMKGRLTLNPLAHVDLFGTILVPLMLTWYGGPVLGWAKPVPINPGYFRDPKKGILLTGAAGPIVNLALALMVAIIVRVLYVIPIAPDFAIGVLKYLCKINIYLAIFNLIPIPPLDGSRIVTGLIPDEWIRPYLSIERFGIFIVLGLLYLGWLDRVLYPAARFVLQLMLG